MSDTPKLRIIFDGPPAHESGRFVEVEDEAGVGVRVGEWVADKEPYWALVIDDPRALRSRIATLEAQVEQAREALGNLVDASIEVSEVPQFIDQATVRPGEAPGDEAIVQMSCGLVRLRHLGTAIAHAETALQALREGGKNG